MALAWPYEPLKKEEMVVHLCRTLNQTCLVGAVLCLHWALLVP